MGRSIIRTASNTGGRIPYHTNIRQDDGLGCGIYRNDASDDCRNTAKPAEPAILSANFLDIGKGTDECN